MSSEQPVSILVVDDEAPIVELLREYLRARGHRVETAGDGAAALTVLEAGDIDLVLTDMKMPRMGGLDLLSTIRGRGYPVGTILMTGYGTIDSAIRAMKDGAQDYILKPFKLREVYAAIIRAAERVRLERETVRLRLGLQLVEHASRISSAELDALYGTLADASCREFEAHSALVAFRTPDGQWVEAARTGAGLVGLDLDALGDGALSGAVPAPERLWHGAPAGAVLLAPIQAQLAAGEPLTAIGVVAVVGASEAGATGRSSLQVYASVVGSTLSRLRLGGGAAAFPDAEADRGPHVAALVERVGGACGLDDQDTAIAMAAAIAVSEHASVSALVAGGSASVMTAGPAQAVWTALLERRERYDGLGSPNRLVGEEISAPGRLLAIATAYDVLAGGARQHGQQLEPAVALELLGEDAGRFDPAMLEAFGAAVR